MEENDHEVNSEIVEVRCPVCEQYVTVVTESPEQGEVYTECPTRGGVMKRGDMVYVNSPWGRFGPYEVKDFERRITFYFPVLVIDNEAVLVDPAWCEPAEPELEEGRWYYYYFTDPAFIEVKRGKYIPNDAKGNAEPVHRRWDDLGEEEELSYKMYIESYFGDIEWLTVKAIYKYAYELVTGEEHP